MDATRARAIAEEVVNLLISKNQDYSGGSGDNISATGLPGLATRLTDKVERLRNLSDGREAAHESIDDTIRDIIGYGIITKLLHEGKWRTLPKLVYLAGPIDDHDDPQSWREWMSKQLGCHLISCFDPAGAFDVNGISVGKQVVEINRAAIRASDLMVAYIPGDSRPFETIREIEYARSIGKRVILVGEIVSLGTWDLEEEMTLAGAIEAIVGEERAVLHGDGSQADISETEIEAFFDHLTSFEIRDTSDREEYPGRDQEENHTAGRESPSGDPDRVLRDRDPRSAGMLSRDFPGYRSKKAGATPDSPPEARTRRVAGSGRNLDGGVQRRSGSAGDERD